MERTALFAGSFNPFTAGHASIVERALPLFDHIVIGVGHNACKQDEADIDRRVEAIKKYASRFPEGKVEVATYTGLTADFARKVGAKWLLRGVRSVKDFEYEREMADINRQISGLETVMFVSLPEYSSLSSSVVRELSSYGYDIDAFLP